MAADSFSPVAHLNRVFSRVPAWARVLGGILVAVLGLVLVTRPLSSLTLLVVLTGASALVSGVVEIVGAHRAPRPAVTVTLGALWVVFGVTFLVWWGVAIDAITVAVPVALVIGGAVRLAQLTRGTVADRTAAGFLAAAEIVLGVVAWRWPDVTLLVVAVVFGIRTVIFGATQVWDGMHLRRDAGAAPRDGRSGIGRVAVAALALVVALGAAGLSAALRTGSPTVDAFYSAPDEMPDEPGKLLRTEPFTRDVPEQATAWRILYTTTRDDDEPALASAIVVAGRDAPAGPRPVIAWAHGTTGFAQHCAPSLAEHPFGTGVLSLVGDIVSNGWVLVATDYIGLGTVGPHPYLIGQGEGRSVLDAVRAARELDGVHLSDETVVWGHSQGGHAALWTGLLASGYAPDAGVVGVAALAPASDVVAVTSGLQSVRGGSVFGSYVIAAYSAVYDDVGFDDYVDPAARTLVRQMSDRCLAEPGAFVSVLSALSMDRDRPYLRSDPATGTLGARLAENVPEGEMPVPVLLAQGDADPLIRPGMQDDYVAARCADGWNIDHRSYPGVDHVGLVAADSPLVPDLLDWTRARLAGDAQSTTC